MNYTLDDIINEFIIEGGGSQSNQYARFYTLAVSGLRELNMDASGTTKVIQMPIKANDTCDLPIDYLKYKVIGLIGTDGQIRSLGRNDNLSLIPSYNDCGAQVPLPQAPSDLSLSTGLWQKDWAGSYKNGEFLGRMFGVHGGQNGLGEFRIDAGSRTIRLSQLQSGIISVAMEYLADINSVEGDFSVHPYIVETLKSWVFWKSIQRDRNRSLGEKQLAAQAYHLEARKSKNRFQSSTISEWYSAIRNGNVASVKN